MNTYEAGRRCANAMRFQVPMHSVSVGFLAATERRREREGDRERVWKKRIIFKFSDYNKWELNVMQHTFAGTVVCNASSRPNASQCQRELMAHTKANRMPSSGHRWEWEKSETLCFCTFNGIDSFVHTSLRGIFLALTDTFFSLAFRCIWIVHWFLPLVFVLHFIKVLFRELCLSPWWNPLYSFFFLRLKRRRKKNVLWVFFSLSFFHLYFVSFRVFFFFVVRLWILQPPSTHSRNQSDITRVNPWTGNSVVWQFCSPFLGNYRIVMSVSLNCKEFCNLWSGGIAVRDLQAKTRQKTTILWNG